jgi:hypothetical protein
MVLVVVGGRFVKIFGDMARTRVGCSEGGEGPLLGGGSRSLPCLG